MGRVKKCSVLRQNSLALNAKKKLRMVIVMYDISYTNIFTITQYGTSNHISISLLVAKETLEGHQRAMMGNMTVEEIYRERKTFSNAVFEVSKKDFVKFGMSIISYTLKDITDEVGYLKVSTEICFFRFVMPTI